MEMIHDVINVISYILEALNKKNSLKSSELPNETNEEIIEINTTDKTFFFKDDFSSSADANDLIRADLSRISYYERGTLS